MEIKEITPQHRKLVKRVREVLGPWRKFTIAVDGVDGSGKTTLARFLSWQTEISIIETDLLLDLEKGGLNYRLEDFKRLIETRHSRKRPVIVEGVFLLRLLEEVSLQPEFLIYVEKQGHKGNHEWSRDFEKYQTKYSAKDKADLIFSWSDV